jgi:hypothetical protein
MFISSRWTASITSDVNSGSLTLSPSQSHPQLWTLRMNRTAVRRHGVRDGGAVYAGESSAISSHYSESHGIALACLPSIERPYQISRSYSSPLTLQCIAGQLLATSEGVVIADGDLRHGISNCVFCLLARCSRTEKARNIDRDTANLFSLERLPRRTRRLCAVHLGWSSAPFAQIRY